MEYNTISIAASGNWLGNDGTWSTFSFQLGTGPQAVELLPATSFSSIWAVSFSSIYSDWADQGCATAPPENGCPGSRGNTYAFNDSTTRTFFKDEYADTWVTLDFISEKYLGGAYNASDYDQHAAVVFDDVILGGEGSAAPMLQSQVIEAYLGTLPYVGMFGLAWYPFFMNFSQGTVFNSVLGSLNTSATSRTSAYWAYTAGAYYQDHEYLGSLTIGGYDSARRNNDAVLTAALHHESPRDILVNLAGISIQTSTRTLAEDSSLNLLIYIDSVVPEIWLPQQGYTLFEQAFGLEWDPELLLYMVNDSQHQTLLTQDAMVDLDFTTTESSGPSSITISLPYKAFYQPISFPLAGITDASILHYFPLKRAYNDLQWVLGRVFLQEAYLAVDYDRDLFYLSQAQFPANQYEKDIKTVYPRGVAPSHPGLSNGAIAGIAVGAAVPAMALILGLLWYFKIRPARKARQESKRQYATVNTDRDLFGYYGNEKGAEEDVYEKRELDATALPRGSVASRSELPSPPLYSPGSPGSPASHRHHPSVDSAELAGDYLTARRTSRRSKYGPWELAANGEYEGRPSLAELGTGSLRTSRQSGQATSSADMGGHGSQEDADAIYAELGERTLPTSGVPAEEDTTRIRDVGATDLP